MKHRARFVITASTLVCFAAAARAQPLSFVTSTIDPGSSGDCKAIADLDLDGKADAILGGSSLAWYESGANFTRHAIRSQVVFQEFTTDMQAADLDGDGDIDIVVGDGDGLGNILWFVNPVRTEPPGQEADPRIASNWQMRTIGTQGDAVHDIEVADLDHDGIPEVVTSGHAITRIWKRSVSGTWSGRNISSLAGWGVSLGDIDRDGHVDIATPSAWLRNPGDVINGAWTRYPINQATIGDECLLADLSGDARLDLVTCDAHNRNAVAWFQQPADPTDPVWIRRVIDPSMGSHHPEAADFDHDGRVDILLGLELAEVAVYLNKGGSPPVFEEVIVAPTGGHNARCGDLDGNSFPDILTCDYIGHPPVRIHLNQLSPPTPCYANCDGSTIAPVLSSNDLLCFMTAFAAGSEYANCDGSPSIPTLTANDFQCYLNRFVAGDAWANCDGSLTAPTLTANDFLCFLNRFVAGDEWANCDGSAARPTLTGNDFQCFLNAFANGCR